MKITSMKVKVLKFLRDNGASKPRDIIKGIKANPTSVYTLITRMLENGELSRTNGFYHLLDTELKSEADTPTSRKATNMEMRMGHKVNALEAEVEHLKQSLQNANVKYYDTLAIVRYLETKIIAQFGK